MDKITKAREILGDDFVIVGIDNWNANVEDYKRILQRLERYENALQQIKYDYEQSLDHKISVKDMYREAIAALKE